MKNDINLFDDAIKFYVKRMYLLYGEMIPYSTFVYSIDNPHLNIIPRPSNFNWVRSGTYSRLKELKYIMFDNDTNYLRLTELGEENILV